MNVFFTRVFVQHLAIGMMVPMTVLWQLERGLSLAQVALITSMWWVAVFALEVPTDVIADRFGRKVSLAFSAVVFCVAWLATGFAGTFWQFAIAKVLTGAAFTLLSGADEAYVFDWLKACGKQQTYKKTWSRVYVVDEIATIIGTATAGLIVWTLGLQSVFFVGASIMSVVILLSLLLPEVRHTHNPDNAVETLEQEPVHVASRGWTLVKRYHFLAWAFIVFAVVHFPAKVLWEPQMVTAGLTVAQVGFAYAALKPFSIAGSVVAGRHSGPVRGWHFALIAFGMTGCFVLVSVSTLWAVLLGLGTYFFVENIFRIFKSEYINQRVASKERATVLSASSFTMSIFGALAVVPAGVIGDYSLAYAFVAIAILKSIGGVIALVSMKKIRDASR